MGKKKNRATRRRPQNISESQLSTASERPPEQPPHRTKQHPLEPQKTPKLSIRQRIKKHRFYAALTLIGSLILTVCTVAGALPTFLQLDAISLECPPGETIWALKPKFELKNQSFLAMRDVSVDMWLDDALLGDGVEIGHDFHQNMTYCAVVDKDPYPFQENFVKGFDYMKFEHIYFAELYIWVHYKRFLLGDKKREFRFTTTQMADGTFTWINVPLERHLKISPETYDPRNRPPINDRIR